MDDWYTLLEVDPTADVAQIRRAYRKQALRYHPDKNSAPEAAEVFQRLGEALRVLTTSREARIEYDFQRHKNQEPIPPTSPVEFERQKELRQVLEEREQAASLRQSSTGTIALDILRADAYARRRAHDTKRGYGNTQPTPAMRTAIDKNGECHVFATVAKAREYVDITPESRLQASWHPREYSVDYEEATLARLSAINMPT